MNECDLNLFWVEGLRQTIGVFKQEKIQLQKTQLQKSPIKILDASWKM